MSSSPSYTVPTIFSAVFLHLLGFTMGGPILPSLRTHFSLDASQTGLITSAFPFGMFFAVSVLPLLSDVIGRKPVMLISYMGVGAFFTLQAAAIHWGMSFKAFLALRVAAGAFAGATTVVKAYIADMSDRDTLPRNMARREAAGTFAFIVGPTLGGLLFSVSSLSTVVLASGVTSFIAAALVLIFLPRQPAKMLDAGIAPTSERPARGRGSEGNSSNWPVLRSIICIKVFYQIGQSFFDAFFGILCAERFGWKPAVLGPVLTLLACFMFMNNMVVYPKLVKYFGSIRVATFGMFAISLGISMLGLLKSSPMMIVAAASYCVGVSCFAPSVPVIMMMAADARCRGRVLAIDSLVASMTKVSSPIVMGMLYQVGASVAFRCAGSFVLVGAILMLALGLPRIEAAFVFQSAKRKNRVRGQ